MAHPEHTQQSLNIIRALKNLEIIGTRFKWDMKNKDVKMRVKMLLESLK